MNTIPGILIPPTGILTVPVCVCVLGIFSTVELIFLLFLIYASLKEEDYF